ncbi:cell division protein FtsQ/DivIB [Nitrincola alkalilacustris]|uniref:cell division protein FtsQ/DivIB n=1 Tax=Nitrincola alkalilacustris TaxID=1571224 RepID=UPI00124D0117|nr:cell division protein FtsQ/DivIB [Nitrincola alkalilacustris]
MNLHLPWLKQPAQATAPEPIKGASRVAQAAPASVSGQGEIDRIWRPLTLLTLLMVFVGISSTLARDFVAWLDQPVAQIKVSGRVEHLDRTHLAQQLGQSLAQPLLSLDLQRLREQVLADPWVHNAILKRHWPPALEVIVTEEVAVARWGDKGLLNHQGDIFWPELKPEYEQLPRLNGPSHETRRVMQQYHDLSRVFAGTGVQLTGLSLEGRGAWNLELDNGIRVVAGREQMMPRLRRFIKIYEAELHLKVEQIEQIDIRYTNGVAVQWRAEEKPDNAG